MNPQSVRNSVDKTRVRNEYLAELNRRSALEQKILNANKILKQTGAITTVPDTRTSTEKAMDKTRLLAMAMDFLKTITDPSTANMILQKLSLDQLNFILNKKEMISADMKKQFALGVTDMAFFMYLKQLEQRLEMTTEELLKAVRESTASKEDLREMASMFRDAGYTAVVNAIQEYIGKIPSFQGQVENSNVATQALMNIISRLIPKGEFNDMMNELEIAVKSNDEGLYNDIAGRLSEYIVIGNANVVEGEQLAEADAIFSGGAPVEGETVSLESVPKTIEEFEDLLRPQQQDILKILRRQKLVPKKGDVMKLKTSERIAEFQSYLDSISTAQPIQAQSPQEGVFVPNPDNVLAYEQPTAELEASGSGIRRRPMRGCGLVKVSPVNIDVSKGIKKEPSYVPFGKHLLNRHKLGEGILMIKTIKGSGVADLEPRKISSKLVKVLKDYADDKMVGYEILDGLSDDEKMMLHKVAQKTQLTDKIVIPYKKTSDEKDNDRFVILKGEIIAGNDNPKLVKEFKLLLIKLIKDKKVPRGEGNEILQMLLELGY
jgi:hypothetical protein